MEQYVAFSHRGPGTSPRCFNCLGGAKLPLRTCFARPPPTCSANMPTQICVGIVSDVTHHPAMDHRRFADAPVIHLAHFRENARIAADHNSLRARVCRRNSRHRERIALWFKTRSFGYRACRPVLPRLRLVLQRARDSLFVLRVREWARMARSRRTSQAIHASFTKAFSLAPHPRSVASRSAAI